ncbi:cytosine deaminase [Paraburkholderia nemoris]|uniref:cytosine deaminase n=1 Tax=Paraburkholderia nemoris TaxID=2793076 RepID=UPI0038BC91FA
MISRELDTLNRAGAHSGYWIRNARVPQALIHQGAADHRARNASQPVPVALKLRGERIERIAPEALDDGSPGIDLDGGLLLPGWVDAHTHLDKGHISPRAGVGGGGLLAAIEATWGDVPRWTRDDLFMRMSFSLRSAFAYGTRAMRTHIDWEQPAAPLAWDVAQGSRQEWAGRIDLQCAALLPLDLFADVRMAEHVARSIAACGGVLGAFVYPMAGQRQYIEQMFSLAERFDLWLDFHVDEHLEANVEGIRAILDAARGREMGGRVMCGHCCALSVAPDEVVRETLADCAAVGATVVSLPFTNLYLQDRRAGASPRLRGIFPLLEAAEAGVRVALASDNHRDPFLPLGDLDPLQTLTLASFASHLAQPLERWSSTVTTTPAMALNLPWDGVLREGAPADLVLLRARDSTEACSRWQADRMVVRAGRFIDTRLPDYRELDSPPVSADTLASGAKR